MFIHLCIAAGHFHIAAAEPSSCNKDHMKHKNTYCLALYRKIANLFLDITVTL